jgi:hypothetical protein
MTDEIAKMLALSTAHITESTGQLLDIGHVPMGYSLGDGGWLVFVPGVVSPGLCPPDLSKVLDYARQRGCTWVKLDHDYGLVNANLPTYEWEDA